MLQHWTYEDRVWLKNNYGKCTVLECATHLNRTTDAVTTQVRYLRKRGWSFDTTRRK